MPNFLDLPAPVIEQLAKVRLDEDIDYWADGELEGEQPRKRFCFWLLRAVGHRGVHAGAWGARHAVVRAELETVAVLGDTEWCCVLLAQREHSEWHKNVALVAACVAGHTEVAGVLIDHGAQAGMEDGQASPLGAACSEGHTETARFLIEQQGPDVNGDHGWALGFAASGGHVAVVALLLEHGADPTKEVSGTGGNAIDLSEEKGEPSVAAMLRAHVAGRMPSESGD